MLNLFSLPPDPETTTLLKQGLNFFLQNGRNIREEAKRKMEVEIIPRILAHHEPTDMNRFAGIHRTLEWNEQLVLQANNDNGQKTLYQGGGIPQLFSTQLIKVSTSFVSLASHSLVLRMERLIADADYDVDETSWNHVALAHNYRSVEQARQAVRDAGYEITLGKLPESLGPMTVIFTGSGNVSSGAQSIFRCLPYEFISPEHLPEVVKNGS
ncbi:unnamed protein product [Protopolystoma xenopodis]|uniref:Uncharacterized protein n=1 Tax=Protopolystoma xenopodis TaxID=117903 RepID=A0A448XJR4_9PLAT|nr:unnamed protein product [Protopolystoma xenopodis]